MVFPPQVKYTTDRVLDEEGNPKAVTFRFMRSYLVASTSQLRKFEEYCDEHHLETEVVLTKANLRP